MNFTNVCYVLPLIFWSMFAFCAFLRFTYLSMIRFDLHFHIILIIWYVIKLSAWGLLKVYQNLYVLYAIIFNIFRWVFFTITLFTSFRWGDRNVFLKPFHLFFYVLIFYLKCIYLIIKWLQHSQTWLYLPPPSRQMLHKNFLVSMGGRAEVPA